MSTVGNIRGKLHRADGEKVVVIGRGGSAVHMQVGPDITPENLAYLQGGIGKPISLWARRTETGLRLLPRKANIPMHTPPARFQ